MQPLAKALRNDLEKTVKSARDIAENAAKACLEQLGVGEANPFMHLSDDQKDLRRRLRAHGRQLGDSRSAKGEQEITRLLEEVAYEHWHRMLFARFLAENDLLMFDGVAVTLEECAELTEGEGFTNEWELAASLAAAMLPQIFRTDSVVFKLKLSPEHQRSLERLIADLPADVFTASDSLGWVYQFWQSKRKEEVNASEVKIGARELPAVTQLFTEPYMVAFLLDNSLGAWWAARRLSADDLRTAQNEEELREKAALPGMPLEYLRFIRNDDESWTPAAGDFSEWPQNLVEFKALDPCCGSGHFLVAAFLMLVPMRMFFEGLSARETVDRVLSENIHGLELDKRCVELAAFALAITAWKYPGAGGYRVLPELHVACSGLAVGADKEAWTSLAPEHSKLRNALALIHDEFRHAPVLGSLLNPSKSIAANLVDMESLAPILTKILAQEDALEKHEAGVIAQGIAKAAQLLSGKYHLVITNVPYLGRSKHTGKLFDFCEEYYPAAKNDLATVFLDRCLEFCVKGGTSNIVLPQNWLFLYSYKKFREKLLKNNAWHIIARLGSGAFETINGEVVKAILISLSRGKSTNKSESLLRNVEYNNLMRGTDVSAPRTAAEKAAQLLVSEIKSVEQVKQLANPDSRVVFEDVSETGELLSKYANPYQGLITGDRNSYIFYFWEIGEFQDDWQYFLDGYSGEGIPLGREQIIHWEHATGRLHKFAKENRDRLHDMHESGNLNWGKKGVAITRIGLRATPYFGEKFDNNLITISPNDENNIDALWSYCISDKFKEDVRALDQKLSLTNATAGKVRVNLNEWKCKETLPTPFSIDPSQWLFSGHPANCDDPLHVAVNRLLGYRWPAELDGNMDLASNQREWVNRCEVLANYADEDGIVCIPSVSSEASAADRLFNLLVAAYGDEWSSDTLKQLLSQADCAGKKLEIWLREKFFTQHCKLFQHRPFIWHIWDGLRDGFAALVNYHKLDYKNLETLTYTYLGDWITRQKQDIANGVDGAAEKLAAAETLKKSLELILEGEKPYDIFVRWKPLDKQPIGWNPDLNDGVRLNIRPFMTVPDVGKKGAGILRDKPNIKWDKDRGKDVESAPWYPVFKGDRINDHHLTLAEKRAAKEAKESSS
ncbi:MAG: SAM-dependent DNA methyltransferase [Negativicutes bacterium]|nr:SAM-dependent DNA methyltransferase [Negativicutes bacterium]